MTDQNVNFTQQNKPNIKDLLDAHKRETQLSMNCVQIGIIQEFDATKQLATVEIAFKNVTTIALDGTETYSVYPLIVEVPVMVLFGGVDFMSMPIEVGDNCIVLFNDRSHEGWLYTGQILPPNQPVVHDLNDAIAIVGLRPLTNSIATYLTNGIRLSHGGGNAKMDLTDNLIATIATLFTHTGSMQITEDLQVGGDFTVLGVCKGNSGTLTIDDDIVQETGKILTAGNGATGTYTIVNVLNGIVTGGS